MKTAKQKLCEYVLDYADGIWPKGQHEMRGKTPDGREVLLDFVVVHCNYFGDGEYTYSATCEAWDFDSEMPEVVLEFWLDNIRFGGGNWIQEIVDDYRRQKIYGD